MIHLGENTKSRIISKGISAGKSNSTYRGLVTAHKKAKNARNFTQCDSLLIGDKCGAHTVPYIESDSPSSQFEHEATTSKLSERAAILLQTTRSNRRRCRCYACKWVLQGSSAGITDGVCR